MKTALGIAVLALMGWLLFALLGPGGKAAMAQNFTTSKDCRACHSEIYDEWQDSHHSMSWTNPAVRLLSNDFANEDCIDCHAPKPIFVTGIGERVLPRATRRKEGVDCIACHQLAPRADGTPGGMAGSVANKSAACQPQEERALAKPDFCSACHNQHKTVDQWRASAFADGMGKKDCLDCHMPYVETGGKNHRTHRFPGGDVLDMVKEAVTLEGAAKDGSWSLTLTNVGAGHTFPTDERSRAADVFWRPLADTGAEPTPWRHLHRIRSPYRSEVDVPDTLLAAGEAREIPVTTEAEGAGEPVPTSQAIEVALFYKRSPYWLDPAKPDPEAEAQLVTKLELRP
jgi:cytochrome c551/c552